MLVSICIPSYNGSRWISETITSVIEQSYTKWELIVSDHDSADETIAIVDSFRDSRIRVTHTPRAQSIAANWNRAVSEGRGDLVKVLGQDDLLYPRAIELEVEAMQRTGLRPAFCFSDRDVVNRTGVSRYRSPRRYSGARHLEPDELARSVCRSGTSPLGEPVAVLFRRETWDEVGGFHGMYLIDLDFYCRISQLGGALYTGHRTCAFRVTRDSWGSRMALQQFSIVPFVIKLQKQYSQSIRPFDVLVGMTRAAIRVPLRIAFQQVLG